MTKLSEWRSTWPDKAPEIYIGLDPGETTGFALWSRRNPDTVVLEELEGLTALRLALTPDKIRMSFTPVGVFTERFDIGRETVRVTPPMDSLYANGWLATELGPDCYTEIGRADAKGFTSHAQLRHYGWWKRGSGQHCRDAAKVLAFAMAHFDEPWLVNKMSSYVAELLSED